MLWRKPSIQTQIYTGRSLRTSTISHANLQPISLPWITQISSLPVLSKRLLEGNIWSLHEQFHDYFIKLSKGMTPSCLLISARTLWVNMSPTLASPFLDYTEWFMGLTSLIQSSTSSPPGLTCLSTSLTSRRARDWHPFTQKLRSFFLVMLRILNTSKWFLITLVWPVTVLKFL